MRIYGHDDSQEDYQNKVKELTNQIEGSLLVPRSVGLGNKTKLGFVVKIMAIGELVLQMR